MIKPDVIVSWPRNCDYPLWRQFIRDHREQFNEIVVVFTETNQGADYRAFVKEAMFSDHVLFMENDPIHGSDDWRDRAIHRALLHSYNAPWVLFTEQDFLPTDFGFFWDIIEAYEDKDVIGLVDGERIHPCFLLMKRTALDRTCKNFGVVPDVSDHFSLIQQDIQNPEYTITFQAVYDGMSCHHMNGLSHNMSLVERGEMVTYKPEEFTNYLRECLKVTVPMDSRLITLIQGYLPRV